MTDVELIGNRNGCWGHGSCDT